MHFYRQLSQSYKLSKAVWFFLAHPVCCLDLLSVLQKSSCRYTLCVLKLSFVMANIIVVTINSQDTNQKLSV